MQPIDQGILESLKWPALPKGINKDSCFLKEIIEFWKTVNITDYIFMISEAWEYTTQLTLRRNWRELLPNFSTGADGSVTAIAIYGSTELSNVFSTMSGCENYWLNCDMEDEIFQLPNDEEIIAEVGHSPKEDEEEKDDEGENVFKLKMDNNDGFQCF